MPSTLNATDYQKVRLWSGIFSIGVNLGLIWAFYLASFFVAPWLSRFDARFTLLFPVAAMLCLGFVFDVLCGHAAETALGRTRQGFKSWARDWFLISLRVAPALYIALLSLSWLRFQSSLALALFAACAALFWIFLTLLLPAFLPRSWQFESDATREFAAQLRPELERMSVPPNLPLKWIQSEDETTVNGAIPPLGRAQIWLAENVARELTPRQAALLIRRDWWFRRTGKHLESAAICVAWLLFGLFGTRFFPAQNALQAALGGAAWMTSWCFVALFVWPHLNRIWTGAADRDLLNCAPREEIEALLRRVQNLNLSDTALSGAKVGVFHPISDLTRRLENLN